jgi:hypothetical protein
MGFTPHQARIALAATDTGLDVEEALEALISNTRETPNIEARDLDRSTPPRRPQRPSTRPNRSNESARQVAEENMATGYQEQADRLISQATVIGRGMLNRANAFWKESRERVQKAYEEHQTQQQAVSPGERRRDERSRWMAEEQREQGFRVDDNEPPVNRREKTGKAESSC